MDHPYKYPDEIVDTKIKGIQALLVKFSPSKPIKGSKLNEITDLRNQIALLVGKPIGQIYGLTRNWSKENLYLTIRLSKDFKNPAAGWWVLYKKNKDEYGRKRNNKKLPKENRFSKRESYLKEQGQTTLC
jgi:hypothetical protein